MPSRTSTVGVATGALVAILPHLGAEPLSWSRAAVFVAIAIGISLLGIFARDHADPLPAPAKGEEKPS